MRHDFLILEGTLSRLDWAAEINDTLNPEYEWLGQWKPATCCVNVKRIGRVDVLILEAFLVAMGCGQAIDRTYSVRVRDTRKRSAAAAEIFEWFKAKYPKLTIQHINGDATKEGGGEALKKVKLAKNNRKKAAIPDQAGKGGAA